MKSLHHRFIDNAKNHLNDIAIHDVTSGQDLTYKKLLIASFILSKKLNALTDEKYIGVMLPVSAGVTIAFIAALMAGKTPVMINYSTGANKNCQYAMKKTGIDLILTARPLLKKVGAVEMDNMIFIEKIIGSFTLADKLLALVSLPFISKLVYQAREDDHAVILFTSGSEKDPKAVPLTHKNIGSNVNSCQEVFHFNRDDSFACVLPFFHVFGLTTSLWIPLIHGGKLICFANPLDYRTVTKKVVEMQPTTMFATPAFIAGYNRVSNEGDFKNFKVLVGGGDKVPRELYDLILMRHGVEILEGFGTTELSPVVAVNPAHHCKVGSIGPALPGVQVKVVSIETNEDLPPNTEGKLWVKGDLVMPGYLNAPEETEKVMHDGWYDTGDIALIDEDGYIFHKGRFKRFVKIAGEMVSLVAVETAARKCVDKEVSLCAFTVPHASKGAEIGIAFSQEVNEDLFVKLLNKDLSSLEMPKHFVVLEDFPLLGSGKVNFREVERLARLKLQK